MKSSEFERLGDWTRKQQWTFEAAIADVANQSLRKQTNPSACIFTDRSTLQRKKSQSRTNEK